MYCYCHRCSVYLPSDRLNQDGSHRCGSPVVPLTAAEASALVRLAATADRDRLERSWRKSSK